MQIITASRLLERFTAAFPASKRRYDEAKDLFPSGVTHDLRFLDPFPLYFDRQLGARKWDIDGHEFIDYWSGHGAMLLGHSHPDVVAAVQEQVTRSSHVGGCHEGEVDWGHWVQRLVPCAEKVRFTGSGTEATLMAVRLARMFTGRRKLLKFFGHFHGWHDSVIPGAYPPYDGAPIPGVSNEIAGQTVVVPPNDLQLLEQTLASDPEIAAVILEPTGGHWGAVPIRSEFLTVLRQLTKQYGQVLIFDEVITGFRVSPGGAQQYYGVVPDLTSLAKIVAGGLPGGCLVGRADIMDQIAIRPGKPKMQHPGTYNANPLSAAAGIAALKLVSTGEPCQRANEMGRLLRNRLNTMFADQGWPWIAYIDFSMFRLVPDYHGPRPPLAKTDNDGYIPYGGDLNQLDGPGNPKLKHTFRQAVLLQGIDMPGLGGWLSSALTEADVTFTVEAINKALTMLHHEGVIGK